VVVGVVKGLCYTHPLFAISPKIPPNMFLLFYVSNIVKKYYNSDIFQKQLITIYTYNLYEYQTKR